ncbi:hypothetical protein ABXN37_27165 [Piscinibacter sakaiensis]|uniref:Uncharacterized protein n=1 Tax=Piscinibacter sakaiensis TaxID=1547922 RepID=A0A0K8P9B8_PISS1|nr:hypothetical protein [Piscinibacter sakaiensis]GAP38780.1 hypothetical protein ISF6_5333 [Piscinibacter sakaiensis]
MAIDFFRQLASSLVRDQEAVLSDEDRERAIALAVSRYSADCPRELLEDVTWAEPGYLGPLPAAWTADVSYLAGAEYPIGEQPPAVLELSVYRSPDGLALHSTQPLPQGAVVRVSLRSPHELTEDADTIPVMHQEAVASYAAHLLAKQLAARYSSDIDPSVGADSASTEGRARNFAARAKDLRGAYYAGIGKPDPQSASGAAAASASAAPAVSVSAWPGRQRMRPTIGGGIE